MDREARAAHEIDVRHRLAELGYGPLERPKLTHIEIRELLEGSIRADRRERKREAARMGVDLDKEQRKREGDAKMVAELQADLDAMGED
jgi:hypothetical protein